VIEGAYMSVEEAARRIGITPGRVRQLLCAGEIRGQKLAKVWAIPESQVEKFCQQPQKTGRPRVGSRG